MKFRLIVIAVSLVLSSCATDDPNKRAKTGAAVGALLGAVIGHQIDDDSGRYVGAAIGAIAGAGVGNYMDKQQAELEKKLAAEAAREELRITRLAGDALKIGVASDATFDFGSSDVKADANSTYAKIANILKTYDKTVIHVVGHTDSVGSDSYNVGLSERRARSVVNVLEGNGVISARTVTEGRGEREPVSGNDSEEGRRLNRRVDIVIKAIVEGQEQQAYAPPPYLGS